MIRSREHQEDKIQLQLHVAGKQFEVESGSIILHLLADVALDNQTAVVGARYNNSLVDLYTEINEAGNLDFVDLTSEDGLRIYRQSLVFLLSRAFYELFPQYKVLVKHSLSKNFYCEIEGLDTISPLDLNALEAKMREMIQRDEPIIPQVLSSQRALKILEAIGHDEKVALLKSIPQNEIKLYTSGSYSSYSYSVLAPSTGTLGVFQLQPYAKGFLLRFPGAEDSQKVAPYPQLPKLGQVFRESAEWAEILGTGNLAGLTRMLAKGTSEANNLIHIAEALHEKKIAQIADEIYHQRERISLILIAGPSSSGKTTFAQRLAIQLRVLGLRPISVSMDDYFVDRDHTPKDAKGDFDFEAIEAVDLQLFNEDLRQLVDCQEVECPIFNFQKGSREWPGRKIQVEHGHPIIIEGIHALNERLTSSINRDNKYKIYISALTQIAIDHSNRIPTTDTRLIRRMVRDHQYRSQSALATLQRWTSVRAGEEKNIFPYQEDADVMFNSALIYELGVLKKYAYPLLKEVGSQEKEFSDAQRLLELLFHFPEIGDSIVPLNSILREFIGGSSIHDN